MYKTTLLILISLVSTAYAEKKPDVKPGLWEISSKVTMSEIAVEMPSMTQTKCITQNTVDPEELLKSHNCQFSQNHGSSNTVTWKMSCMEQGVKMKGSGSMTYHNTSFNGHFDLEMDGEAGPVTMSTQIDGRYLGACK